MSKILIKINNNYSCSCSFSIYLYSTSNSLLSNGGQKFLLHILCKLVLRSVDACNIGPTRARGKISYKQGAHQKYKLQLFTMDLIKRPWCASAAGCSRMTICSKGYCLYQVEEGYVSNGTW